MKLSPPATARAASEVLPLADGRTLGYGEFGDSAGVPLMLFHGCPGSRFHALTAHRAAEQAGVRLIAPERPGYGLSSPKEPRRLSQWPEDVLELADHLQLERFHVLGASGGGPHALACAARIRPRLLSATVVASAGPMQAEEATEGMPWALRSFWRSPPSVRRRIVRTLGALTSWLPDRWIIPVPDHQASDLLSAPELQAAFALDIREALRDGGRGLAAEVDMLASPWDIDLSEIRISVRLWHGALDRNCPIAMAEHLLAQIPKTDATIFPDEGHMCAFPRLGTLFAAYARAKEAEHGPAS